MCFDKPLGIALPRLSSNHTTCMVYLIQDHSENYTLEGKAQVNTWLAIGWYNKLTATCSHGIIADLDTQNNYSENIARFQDQFTVC